MTSLKILTEMLSRIILPCFFASCFSSETEESELCPTILLGLTLPSESVRERYKDGIRQETERRANGNSGGRRERMREKILHYSTHTISIV